MSTPINPVDCFNRGLQAATAFSLEADIFGINDSTTLERIGPETADETVVLASVECDFKVTAGMVRKARALAQGLTLPGGWTLAFYAPVILV